MDVPDVFILRSTGAAARGEAAYWRERPAAEARHHGGGVWFLGFGVEQNEADGDFDPSAAAACTLVHRPGGVALGERAVFDGWPASDLFGFDGTVGSAMAYVAALEFELGERLLFPSGTLAPATPDSRTPPPKYVVSAPTRLADPEDPLQRSVEAPGVAFRPRVDPAGRTWPAGTTPPEGGAEEGEPPRAAPDDGAAPDPLTGLETWVSVFRVREREVHDVGEATQEADVVGAWRADADGTYVYAAYAPDAAEGDGPRVAERAAPFVLFSTELTRSTTETLFAHVSYGPLPHARAVHLAQRVADNAFDGPLIPLGFRPGAAGPQEGDLDWLTKTSEHAAFDGARGLWRWSLPDPARVTARLAEDVDQALARYEAWQGAVGEAGFNARLVAATCFRPEHRRGYLDTLLRPHDPNEVGPQVRYYGHSFVRSEGSDTAYLTNMAVAWAGFRPAATGTERLGDAGARAVGASDSQLEHFAYGLRRQDAYLRHRARVAANRLEAWFDGPLYEEFERDLAVLPRAGTVGRKAFVGLCERVLEGQASMCAAGAGGRFLSRGFVESELPERLQRLETEALGKLADPLLAADAGPWTAFLDADPFTTSWTLAKEGGAASAAYLETLAVVAITARSVVEGGEVPRGVFAVLATALIPGRKIEVERLPDGSFTAGDYRIEKTDGVRTTLRHRPLFTGEWRIAAEESSWTETKIHLGSETRALRVAAVVGAFDAAMTSIDAVRKAGAGEFGLAEAVGVGDAVSTAVQTYEAGRNLRSAYELGRLGKVLSRAAPWIEAASAGVAAYQAFHYTSARGVLDETYRNDWALAAAVTGGAGTVLIAKAGLAGGAAAFTAPAAIVGFVFVGAGLALGWWTERADEKAALADDPLKTWLTTGSVWGKGYPKPGELADLFTLVQPGWTPGEGAAVDGRALEGQSATFVKTAYKFPVGVEPRLEGGRPVALTFHVAPDYLPASGTLALSASVSSEALVEPVLIKCAVHYVRLDDNTLRYRVSAPGEPAALGGDLAARALDEWWAPAAEAVVPVPVEGGATGAIRRERRLALAVHTGPALRELDRALTAPVAAAVGQQASGRVPPGVVGLVAGARTLGAEQAAALAGGVVWPGTAADPDGDLGAALRAGRFTVAGACVFDPARPLDRTPAMPEPPAPDGVVLGGASNRAADDPLLARQEFLYRYPPG